MPLKCVRFFLFVFFLFCFLLAIPHFCTFQSRQYSSFMLSVLKSKCGLRHFTSHVNAVVVQNHSEWKFQLPKDKTTYTHIRSHGHPKIHRLCKENSIEKLEKHRNLVHTRCNCKYFLCTRSWNCAHFDWIASIDCVDVFLMRPHFLQFIRHIKRFVVCHSKRLQAPIDLAAKRERARVLVWVCANEMFAFILRHVRWRK